MRTNTGQILYIPRIGQRADFQHPLMRGCVGWWPLNDGAGTKAVDLSTGGNDFTAIGTPAWASTSKGTAVEFGGVASGDAYKSATSNILSFGDGATDSPFSITAWINIDSGLTVPLPIFTKTDGNGTGSTSGEVEYNFNVAWSGSVHNLRFIIYDNNGNQQEAVTGATSLQSGTWHFCCAIYDGTGGTGLNVYLDGSLESPTRTSQGSYVAMHGNLTPAYIGVGLPNEPVFDQWMNGNIQNVRVYDRALTATEILELYTNPWSGLSMPSETRYFFVPTQVQQIFPPRMKLKTSINVSKGGRIVI